MSTVIYPPMICRPYDKQTQKRVLAAKVAGDLCAYEAIITEFVEYFASIAPVIANAIIMPMPSSLWGRIRGRIDLAHHMAKAVARMNSLPLVLPPWDLGWHLQKKSMVDIDQRRVKEHSHRRKSRAIIQKLCVIDDLVTTGSSFLELADRMNAKAIVLVSYAGNFSGFTQRDHLRNVGSYSSMGDA
jgi:predicted amidophosphoribosyltransferase